MNWCIFYKAVKLGEDTYGVESRNKLVTALKMDKLSAANKRINI